KIHKRSLIFLFTDMFQTTTEDDKLFEALRHLKYNKHEVVLFHLMDKGKEVYFNFGNSPKRFLDVETGEHIDLYAENVRETYNRAVDDYFTDLRLKCGQYRIRYVEVDIRSDFSKVRNTYLVERQQFV